MQPTSVLTFFISPISHSPSDGSMHIVKQNGYLETRVLCEQINKQTPDEMMAVVEKTTGWWA
jgi:hypothetical protein